MYLDFQNVFDNVPHNLFIFKVKGLSIASNADNWIKNCLNNRKQRVVFNGNASDWPPITSGVYRTVLFIVYRSDIYVGINIFIAKFTSIRKLET